MSDTSSKYLRCKLRPNSCSWRRGYYWQPIGTYQHPIQRYHRRPSTTYRLATIQNVTDRRQTDRTSYHKRDRTTQYGRLKIKCEIKPPRTNMPRTPTGDDSLQSLDLQQILHLPKWVTKLKLTIRNEHIGLTVKHGVSEITTYIYFM